MATNPQPLNYQTPADAPEWFDTFLQALNPVVRDLTSSYRGQIDSTNLAVDFKTVRVKTPLLLAAAAAPALQNSWVNFGSGYENAGYSINAEGRVFLRGLIQSGTATDGTVLFTLPAGYRSVGSQLFSVPTNGTAGIVGVHSDGTVTAHHGIDSANVSLSGINFQSTTSSVPTPGTAPFPIYLQTRLSKRPSVVLIARAAYTNSSAAVTESLSAVSWVWTKDNRIRVDYVGGVVQNTDYTLTFMVLA